MLQSSVYFIVLLLLLLLFSSTLRFLQLTYYLHRTAFEHTILEYIHHYLKKKLHRNLPKSILFIKKSQVELRPFFLEFLNMSQVSNKAASSADKEKLLKKYFHPGYPYAALIMCTSDCGAFYG